MQAIRLLILPLTLAALQLSAQAQPLPRRENIILIVADGMGCGDLSCYGQTQFETPSLDRLALGGIRFTNYSAGDALGSAARADLLLGKHVAHAPGADVELGPTDTTIADLLKDSGYFTGLIGEWNLGGQDSGGAPWRQGFEVFAGYFDPVEAANPYADYISRHDPKFDRQGNLLGGDSYREPLYPNTDGKQNQYVPDSLMRYTINFNRLHHPDRFNQYRPYFVLLDETIPGQSERPVPSDAPFSEESWPQSEKNRAASIVHLDDDIGRLLEKLKETGQESNTVIFFTSDTVPRKEGGVDPKFFDENPGANDLRVPMIVYWPGKIAPGQVSGLKCSAPDVLPTIADIALIKPPANIEGVSFSPTLFGQ